MNPALFSSATDEWATPDDFFAEVSKLFAFELDVCATPENAKAPRFFTKADDGLAQEWRGVCWMNPPYGDPEQPCERQCKKKRCKTCEQDPTDKCASKKCGHRGHHVDRYIPGIRDWMAKADASSRAGATVVCLVPARTDTAWWHYHVQPVLDGERAGDVLLLRGRLKFGGAKNSAPFPSALVVFLPPAQSAAVHEQHSTKGESA